MAGAVPDDFWVEWHPSRPHDADVGEFEWVRITNAIRELACNHGFDRDIARVEAGAAVIVLDDRDRSLDPSNPHAPNRSGLTPLRHMRIRASAGGTTYTIWRGFTVSWTPGWAVNDAWVVLEGRDALMAAAGKVNESTLSRAIRSMSPTVWLPLDDGGTPVAQEYTGQNAAMTATRSGGNILPFHDQPSTSFPSAGAGGSKGDVATLEIPFGLGATGFSIAAVVAADRPEAQIVLSCGPNPAVDANVPSGDVQLTIDAANTYSLRVGNAGGKALYQLARPKADPSTMLVARWSTSGLISLFASAAERTVAGNTVSTADVGGSWTPRSGVLRVGAGLDAANANPFLGQLSNVAVWQRYLTDDDVRHLVAAYQGAERNSYLLTASTSDVTVGWVLDRLAIPAARRVLPPPEYPSFGGTSTHDLTALEMMSRAAATQGGRFFADRQGRYVLTLPGAVGPNRGTYDTRPTSAAVMTADESGIETSSRTWVGHVNGLAGSSDSLAGRSTARAAVGAASLAVTRQPATTGAAGASVRRNQWSEAHSTLADGTVGPWVAQGTATVTNPATAGRDGTNGFLRVAATGAGGAKADATLARSPCAPGRAYRAAAWIRAQTVARSARLYWEFADGFGTPLSTVLGATVVPTTAAGNWTIVVVEAEAPEGAKFRRLGVEIIGPTTAGEAWQIDGVNDGPATFVCREGQVLDVTAKVSASVAAKAASVGVVLFFADGRGAMVLKTLPSIEPPTAGFSTIAGQVTVASSSPGFPVGYYTPVVTVDSLAPGETVWFDEIDVRPAAAAALDGARLAHDDRSFFTGADLTVTWAAEPQVVRYRHPNAAVFGAVVYDAPTQFVSLANALDRAEEIVGDALPILGVVEADVAMGAAGVDAGKLLVSDIGDQVVTIARIPGAIGFRFSARDAFLTADPVSLGVTAGGSGVTDIATWVVHGPSTWGKDAAGAFCNGAGAEQATLNVGALDQDISAALTHNGAQPGIVARWQDPSNYLLLRQLSGGGVQLVSRVAGAFTALGPSVFPPAGPVTVRLRVAGAAVAGSYNGAEFAWGTTALAGRRAGLYQSGTAGRIDDFAAVATDLAPEPHLSDATIVSVAHRYDRERRWRTRWGLTPNKA